MESKANSYIPINCHFYDILIEKATLKQFCKIQYFTELQELITLNTIITDIFTKNKEEFMLLVMGELVRLDKIVTINGVVSPNYAYFEDFSCDC